MKKGISVIAIMLVIVILIGVCGMLIYNATILKNKEVNNPVLSLEVENYGTIKIELYPEYAPNTVKNIIALANNGYYDGKIFYGMDDIAVYVGRDADGESDNPTIGDIDKSVVKEEDTSTDEETSTDETVQDVDTTEENEADYEYEIDGEFVANDFKQNTLKHEKGVVSLVRADYTKQISSLTSESYNSGSSQFTILMDNADNLNGMYAAFGKVIEGMDLVEKIYSLDIKTDDEENDSDSDDSINAFAVAPVITSATVETYGVEYGLPETHEAFDYSEYLQEMMSKYYSSQQ